MKLAVSIGVAVLALASAAPADAQRGLKSADATPRKAEDGAPTAIGGGSGLVVGGIEVDVGGTSANDARLAGWREAQRLAWPQLWARLSGRPESSAPRLADSVLDGMVSAIEIEREQIGPRRYVARLAVVFDRIRASAYLGGYANLASSPPFLLFPVLQDAAARHAHEAESPWREAWTRLRAGESPIDYVRIQPTPGDVILLNAWQADRRHLFLWRALIDRYQVADVLIPELILDRPWFGGPVSALLIVRFGVTGRELGRVRLVNRAGDVTALVDAAVREADRRYVAALRAGNLLPDPNLIPPDPKPVVVPEPEQQFVGGGAVVEGASIRVRVPTPDDATLQAIQRGVAGTPGVLGVRLQSFVLGGESVLEIVTPMSADQLRRALDTRGLRLDEGVLRRRAAGEAPLEADGPQQLLPAGD